MKLSDAADTEKLIHPTEIFHFFGENAARYLQHRFHRNGKDVVANQVAPIADDHMNWT